MAMGTPPLGTALMMKEGTTTPLVVVLGVSLGPIVMMRWFNCT